MAVNTIALAEKYLPFLDEVYKDASMTAILDTPKEWVKFDGANKIQLYKMEMEGLGDYSRANGYPKGAITSEWETKTLTQDRGKSFNVDEMDNEESLGLAFGRAVSMFMREHVVPEIDAYRFAKYANAAGKKATGVITDAFEELDAAEEWMNNREVTREGRIIFASEKFYRQIKKSVVRHLVNEGNVSREVLTLDGKPVIRVSEGRFNDAVQIGDNGFTPNGQLIDFMIVHPSAVAQVAKHEKLRIFSPEVNQEADAWKFDYRIYHDCFNLDNKVNGIYVHTPA